MWERVVVVGMVPVIAWRQAAKILFDEQGQATAIAERELGIHRDLIGRGPVACQFPRYPDRNPVVRELRIHRSHIGYFQRIAQCRFGKMRFLGDSAPGANAPDLTDLEAKTNAVATNSKFHDVFPKRNTIMLSKVGESKVSDIT